MQTEIVQIAGGYISDNQLDVSKVSPILSHFVCVIMHYLGMMADVIFIACSAWFLINDERVNTKKIAGFLGDKYFITIAFIIVASAMGLSVTTSKIISALQLGSLWFIICYVLMYAFHPCLNAVCRALDKRRHLLLNVVMISLYLCLACVIDDKMLYCRFLGFFIIYFIVAYVKVSMTNFSASLRKNLVWLILGIVGQLALLLGTNYLGLHMERFSNDMLHWDTLINPFSIIIAIASLNIANRSQYVNKTINYLSSLSLLVYMFHANNFARTVIAPHLTYNWAVANNAGLLETITITTLALLFCSVLLSILYKHTLQKWIYKLSEFILILITKFYRKVECSLMKVD